MGAPIPTEPADEATPDLAAVTQQVGQAKSSFYTAMRLLPEDRRNGMYAIYAFCREVDDIADEPAPQDEKQRGLAVWRDEIDGIYAGRPAALLVGRALVGPIRAFDLQKRDFHAVIDGMAMDAERDIVAPDAAELDLYCDRVASAVGRLSVRIFGPYEPRADEVAEHLGRALQLTNILRDIDEDAERGRLYLPREALVRHGIATRVPLEVVDHPAIHAVCAELSIEADRRFRLADVAMAACSRRTMRPARMMSGVYAAILRRLIRRGWSAPRPTVKVPKLVKIWIALTRVFF
ncbi:MAG TPA: presqualene diphosphate synthase HpnD [Aliidongia sp.]|uniref:presqualene diphosphate synthase HpnD n=1 Tax=Aliidongia sp. TaxID=1914230 RepID=UPI002DDD0993|nr:presqualene diphosphate synthase HpnD [Aliidongia sp.]HEV2674208.1 presqualene diphosphate synthase HpnD [Aliidongia sp.]